MKRVVIIFVSLVLLCLSVSPAKCETPCLVYRELAKTIMTLRQYGYSARVCRGMIIDTMRGLGMPPRLDAAIDSIVEEAYSRPYYSTVEYKHVEINDFASEKYFECIETMYR